MDDNELVAALKAKGYRFGKAAVRSTDRQMLYEVNDVFMFRQDVLE